jgi:uncharacterized protein
MAKLAQLLAQLGQLGQLAELEKLLAQLLTSSSYGSSTQLLVLQATPFCNADCAYCYLPNRNERSRMSLDTVRASVRWIFESGLAATDLTIVWHAGEPLVLPPAWYGEAISACEEAAPSASELRFAVQTNATLIDDEWCDLFLLHKFNVGVSLDGPAWLHDRYRRNRRGGGTHAAAMRGVRALQRRDIPFHAICVVTEEALSAVEEIMDFFTGIGVSEVGFNIDEQEGARQRSSLNGDDLRTRFNEFMERAVERAAQPGAPMLREVRHVVSTLLDPGFDTATGSDENEPFRIVTILHDGRLSTFSPELAGLAHSGVGELTFGDVHTDSLASVLASDRFRSIAAEIAAGVSACRATCPYFRLCRGGAPSNKLAELENFAGTETQHCRLSRQVVADVVLSRLRTILRRDSICSTGITVGVRPFRFGCRPAPRARRG